MDFPIWGLSPALSRSRDGISLVHVFSPLRLSLFWLVVPSAAPRLFWDVRHFVVWLFVSCDSFPPCSFLTGLCDSAPVCIFCQQKIYLEISHIIYSRDIYSVSNDSAQN